MTDRYVPRAAFEYDLWGGRSTTANVAIIDDDARQPRKTGLLDAHGTPLYRVPETVPFGFHRFVKDPRA